MVALTMPSVLVALALVDGQHGTYVHALILHIAASYLKDKTCQDNHDVLRTREC